MLNNSHDLRLNPLHTLFSVGSFAGWTDGELLEQFVNGRGEIAERAFAVLVERHGAAVLRLCRGVLGDRDEAEDALQATFFVLARRARSIRDREAVGRWLLSAAYRVAGCARAAGIRRRRHERRAAEAASALVVDREPSDLGPLLREELGELPEKFQAPLVLCYLEGLTQDDVARRLGWPIGTVRSRLARGRERLRHRLLLRGVSPAVAVLAVGTSRDATAVTVSESLIEVTALSATRFASGSATTPGSPSTVFNLAHEVLSAMIWTKCKLTAAILLTSVVLVASAGVVSGQAGKVSEKANPPAAKSGLGASQRQTARDPQAEVNAAEIRLRQAEAELEKAQADLELAKADAALMRDRLANVEAEPRARPAKERPRLDDQERRLRAIEEKLDRLLAEPGRRRPANAYEERARIFEPDADARNKETVWNELVRAGYIGRFDADTVAPDQLYANLYRRFLGRRPITEEMTPLLASYGPGVDQLRLDPETAVRRLLNCPAFWSSPLAKAIVGEPASQPRVRR